MTHFFLWNPLNVVDGEAKWLGLVILWICGGWMSLQVLDRLIKHLLARRQRIGFSWLEVLYSSLSKPLFCLTWFYVIVQAMDIVCDNTLSGMFERELNLIFRVASLALVGWAFFRLKRIVVHYALSQTKKNHHGQELQTGHHNHHHSLEPDTILVISKLASFIVCLFLTFAALEILGMSFTTILAFGGVSGLAIAIASQEIIANFFGSVMIHVTRPFKIGDYITVHDQSIEGYVRSIGWYQTRISGYSTRTTVVPNAVFTKAVVTNKSHYTHRLLDETVTVPLEDLHKVPTIISNMENHLSLNPNIDQEQKINVWIRKVSPSGIEIGLFALSVIYDENEFYTFRDEILMAMTKEVEAVGATLLTSPFIAVGSPA